MRMIQIRGTLRNNKRVIYSDKGVPAKVKIKAICVMLAADGMLKFMLRLKRNH